MNTKIIAAVVAVIILLGLGGYFILGKNATKQNTTPTNTASQNDKSQNSVEGTITSIFGSAENRKCDFSVTASNGGKTSGTVYVSGVNARANMIMTANSKTTNTYLVRNDKTYYIWGDDLPTGIKMTMDASEFSKNMQSSKSTFDANQKVKFNCISWSVDNSLFTPPSSIKFTDTGTLMMPKTTGSQTPNAQNACAGITDPTTKASCENAMHQNGY